ncbi:MAG: hypothetical protein HQL86_02460, partial [Magnetococcales bacterium]|nr:hypothetical protein [Magnetococcales bacterium]
GNCFQKTGKDSHEAARSPFFAKDAKNAFFEERGKVKTKTLGDEYPRFYLFFTCQKDTFQAGCGLALGIIRESRRKILSWPLTQDVNTPQIHVRTP